MRSENVRIDLDGLNSPIVMSVHKEDDRVSKEILEHGVWEAFESAIVVKRLRSGAVFVDVGANIGYYTLLASSLVGAQGHVLAFEPERKNFDLLRDNSSRYGAANIRVVHAGLSDEEGDGLLYLCKDNLGDHRMFDDEARPHQRIKLIVGDGLLQRECDRVDFLKIDTQGAEANVVAGLQETIAVNRDHLDMIIEFWPYGLIQAGRSARALLNLLEPFRFDLFVIDHVQHRLLPTDCAELLDAAENSNLLPKHKGFINLFLTATSAEDLL
jgi:FkbM family methyltransferase|tara:strand:- start:7668 stop:8477 length:810 start_codon:yes stop_codon:yes gene_type:complete